MPPTLLWQDSSRQTNMGICHYQVDHRLVKQTKNSLKTHWQHSTSQQKKKSRDASKTDAIHSLVHSVLLARDAFCRVRAGFTAAISYVRRTTNDVGWQMVPAGWPGCSTAVRRRQWTANTSTIQSFGRELGIVIFQSDTRRRRQRGVEVES